MAVPARRRGSGLDAVVAHRLPAVDQIPFLSASARLAGGSVVGMDMGGAVGCGVLLAHMPLKPLVQIASLSNVDRSPGPVFGLHGIDKIAGQRLERSVQGINLVGILLPGLAGPIDQNRSGTLRLPVVTE